MGKFQFNVKQKDTGRIYRNLILYLLLTLKRYELVKVKLRVGMKKYIFQKLIFVSKKYFRKEKDLTWVI